MNSAALALMLTVKITVTVLALYFFYRILYTKSNKKNNTD